MRKLLSSQCVAFILCLIILFVLHHNGDCQIINNSLYIGDEMPNVKLSGFVENPNKKVQTTNLRGQGLIFDFWSIWCSSCIASMPELDSLQQQFQGRLKIILVTRNSRKEVVNLFKRIKLKPVHLEIITGDTILHNLFPHVSEPHHVWIDKNGVYKYSSFDFNTNKKNISRFLSGKKLDISQKMDFGLIREDTPLLQLSKDIRYATLNSYSLFFKDLYKFTASNQIKFFTDSITKKRIGFKAVNATALNLLRCAFAKDVYGFDVGIYNLSRDNRVIIEVKRPKMLFYPKEKDLKDNWIKKNTFSYEVKLPTSMSGGLYHKMQEDLNFFLPYYGTIEYRMTNSYVLVRNPNISIQQSNAKQSFVKIDSSGFIMRNQPITELVRRIIYSGVPDSLPFIDKTSFHNNIDIFLPFNSFENISQLNKELGKYGFQIIKRKVNIKMLVIKDKESS